MICLCLCLHHTASLPWGKAETWHYSVAILLLSGPSHPSDLQLSGTKHTDLIFTSSRSHLEHAFPTANLRDFLIHLVLASSPHTLVFILLIKINFHGNGIMVFRTIHPTPDLFRWPVSTVDTMRVTHKSPIPLQTRGKALIRKGLSGEVMGWINSANSICLQEEGQNTPPCSVGWPRPPS